MAEKKAGWCGWKSWLSALLAPILLYLIYLFGPRMLTQMQDAPTKKSHGSQKLWIYLGIFSVIVGIYMLAIRKSPEEWVGVLKSITQSIAGTTEAKPSCNVSGAKLIMIAVAVALALAFAYYLISRREVADAPKRDTVDLEAGKGEHIVPIHKPKNFLGFWPGRGKSRRSLGVPKSEFTSRLSSGTGRSRTGRSSRKSGSRSRSRRSRSRYHVSRASKPRARRMSSTFAVRIGASRDREG